MPEILAIMTSPPEVTPLSDVEYRQATDRVLVSIEAAVDRWLQDDVIDIDPLRTGGLLELAFPKGGKIVVNTQPPLHELWLASPAGAYHFRHVGGRWLDTKDGSEFFAVASREISALGAVALQLTPV